MSPHRHDAPAPRLRPGLVLLRRSRTTWQIGIDTAHAVLVRGADDATVRGLHALEPHRAPDPDARLDASVLARLAEQGLLTSPPPAAASDRLTSRHARRLQQLRGDSATAELVGAPDPVPRRRDARVAVAGSGPVAALVATGLAHAGIGTVAVLGPRRPVVPTDLTPAGPRLAEVGRPWVDAVSAAVRALGAATTLVEAPVDLAVLTQAADADAPWCDPEHADLWLRLGTPHLAATAAGRSGDISPVVEPGRTGCLRCRELARIDADPSWPALAVGLRRRPGGAVPVALSAPLAAVTAQLALARAVSYVDGAAGPATARGLLVRLPGTDVTTYPLAPHPACGCRWGRGLVTMGA